LLLYILFLFFNISTPMLAKIYFDYAAYFCAYGRGCGAGGCLSLPEADGGFCMPCSPQFFNLQVSLVFMLPLIVPSLKILDFSIISLHNCVALFFTILRRFYREIACFAT